VYCSFIETGGAGMDNRDILVVEDDKIMSKYISDILKDENYNVSNAYDGLSALEKYESGNYSAIITDLEMPQMDGVELIQRLQSKEFPPVIIVSTVKNDPDTIISIMKMGVYTYLLKPINSAELIFSVNKGCEYSKILRANRVYEKEKNIRLENQLEWYRWRERFVSGSRAGSGSSIFQGLLTSFNQGAGFGSMVSMIDLLAANAKKENGYYRIDSSFFDAIIENNKIASKALDVLSFIRDIIDNGLVLKKGKASEIHDIFIFSSNELKKYSDIKNQHVIVSDIKPSFEEAEMLFNYESMQKVANELLLNAFKYSEKDSDVIVLSDMEDGNFRISVISMPEKTAYSEKGISIEYENIIFEPFCRLTKSVQESYHTLEFGLGLTMVEKIIKAHKGKIKLYNIKDHAFVNSDASRAVEVKVCAVMSIPVLSVS